MNVSFFVFIFHCVVESSDGRNSSTQSLTWMVDRSKSPQFISRSYDVSASLFSLASFPSLAST